MATSVRKPHVVVTEKDSEEEDVSDNQEGSEDEGSSDGGDEEGSGEDSLDGDVDDDQSGDDSVDRDVDDEASGEESADGDDDEKGPEEDSADGGDEEAEDENEENPNAGWAEAMAKILRKKTPEDKSCVLLKSKQQKKLNETERKERLEKKKKADKKRTWEMMCRVKPDIVQDREKEKNLQRTATRGVVQLFNAVRQHQKKVDEKVKEVGASERKKAKVLSSISKKDFIDVLKGSAGCTTPTATSAKPEKEEKPAWSVLRDDFMMGSSMKDWDKESDAEPGGDEPEPAADLNSDSD